MQGTDKLNTITNIVFVLTDILETNLLEMQQQYKKEGFELRHDSKNLQHSHSRDKEIEK